jgi:hypothetical protein
MYTSRDCIVPVHVGGLFGHVCFTGTACCGQQQLANASCFYALQHYDGSRVGGKLSMRSSWWVCVHVLGACDARRRQQRDNCLHAWASRLCVCWLDVVDA